MIRSKPAIVDWSITYRPNSKCFSVHDVCFIASCLKSEYENQRYPYQASSLLPHYWKRVCIYITPSEEVSKEVVATVLLQRQESQSFASKAKQVECLQWKTWTAEEIVNQKLRKKRQRKRREDGGSTGRAGLPPTMAGGEMSWKGALNILLKFSFNCQTFTQTISNKF